MMVTTEFSKALTAGVAAQPHHDAVKLHLEDCQPVRWTNKELDRQVVAFAKGMEHSDFAPGSKIVIWTKDVAEGIVAQLGAIQAGLNVTVLDAEANADDLAKAMGGARGLIFSPNLQPNEAAVNAVLSVIPEIADVKEDKVISSQEFPELRYVFTTGFYRREGMVKYAKIFSYDPTYTVAAASLGKIEYAGPGTPTKVSKLPFFDETVTFKRDDADFE